MIEFSRAKGKIAGVIRFLVHRLPYRGFIPILQGEARGLLWKRSSGDEGYWLGSYEAYKQRMIAPFLKPGAVFYDIGAYAGFYTLMACKKGARVYAFEPDESNVRLLNDHVVANRCGATVLPIALSAADGIERFRTHESPTSHQLAADGDREVPCRSIDSLVHEIEPPTVLKIDAEGAEAKILQGAAETIRRYRPVIFVEGPREGFERYLPGYSLRKFHDSEYVCLPPGYAGEGLQGH